MNWPNFREASTKRGIVWIAGGAWIVFQAARGHAVNPDVLLSKIDFWLGVIMTVAGTFGLLPDAPKTTKIELPPIDLQGRSESSDADLGIGAVQPADRLRVSAPSPPPPPTDAFGAGWGDK